MMDRFTGRSWSLAAAVLLVALFALFNTFVQRGLGGARIDFTERSLYTLTDATKSALRDLTEPVDLTFVYSRQVGQEYPRIRSHAARVRELLDAYVSHGDGMLRVRELDATPFSEAEDVALAAGLAAVPSQGADPLYFGLIGRNSVDDERIISFLAPEREGTLEYDLTRIIARLDDPSPARIGLISPLQGLQGDGRETGYAVLGDLARSYSLVRIDEDFASLPEDLDALILAQLSELSEFQLWLIDQFVMRKGRLIWLADPAAKIAVGGGVFDLTSAPRSSGFDRLGAHWGVTVSESAVADAANALPVQTSGPDGRAAIASQPLFIAVPPANISRTDPITAQLQRALNFGAPGAIEVASSTPFQVDMLAQTGPAPSFIDAEDAVLEMTPNDVILAYDTLTAPLMLVARLTGEATSAFPEGRPNLPLTGDPVQDELLRAEAAGLPAHINASETPANVILVADVDFLDDGFYINPNGRAVIADNGAFLLNAVDALSGLDGLLELRSRGESLRPMTRVDAMRAAAEQEFFEEQGQLEERLMNVQGQLDTLQSELAEDLAVGVDLEAGLTAPERAQLQALRAEILETRERLRTIERDYRRDIDNLEAILKAVNIWGGAALAVLLGLFIWVRGRARGTP